MVRIPIWFFTEDIDYTLKNKQFVRNWIKQTVLSEKHRLLQLNFIFCSDVYLHSINTKYLNHNSFTDIITFDNSSDAVEINGDIFISIERVHENAERYNTLPQDELHRVMIHGVLHLCGYRDKKKTEKLLMTEKEDFYLLSRNFTPVSS